ncbi:hypothetical protein GGR56DRAFT_330839 [Xylariaceae sp. FL0804]|nr:hypothetical protein GGR56DRAFT_330839 [Xylariaceae sp. FL0804]
MSFGPQVVMPGAFHYDALGGGPPATGVHPGLFRPPGSPSASSSMYLGRSTGSLNSDASTPAPNPKRKRHRTRDSAQLHDWTPAADMSLNGDSGAEDRLEGHDQRSGERHYILAGQIQTPNGVVEKQLEEGMEESIYSDVDYRRALGSKRLHDGIESPVPRRIPSTSIPPPRASQPNGWSSIAFHTLGGVVGRVWEFCKAGAAFRGFHAGGGAGFVIQETAVRRASSAGQNRSNGHAVPTPTDSIQSPFPGGFPESDYSPFYYERESPASRASTRAAKRRQVEDGASNDELRRNWVVVGEAKSEEPLPTFAPHPSPSSRPQRPDILTRRISKPVSRLSVAAAKQQQVSKVSHAGSPSLSHREPASFASPRSPVTYQAHSRLPVPSRPQSPNNVSPSRLSQHHSRIPSPSQGSKHGHRRSHSAASAAVATPAKMKKRGSMQEMHEHSPRLDAEAKRLAEKRLRQEKEADVRINDFNARIRDMIRQGKEALGTTIEVEQEGEGGLDIWEDE